MKKSTANHANRNTSALCLDKELGALLSRYQDNELEPALQEKVSVHLEICEACRHTLGQMKQISAGIHALKEIEPAMNFNAVLMERITQKQAQKARWSLGFSFPSVVYSIVFVLFLALGLWVNGKLAPQIKVNTDTIDVVETTSQETQLAGVFSETQGLNLIQVQEQTMALLDVTQTSNGENNE